MNNNYKAALVKYVLYNLYNIHILNHFVLKKCMVKKKEYKWKVYYILNTWWFEIC